MIEGGLSRQPQPKLSSKAEAVQARMLQTARDLRKTSLGTPELLVAMLDEPAVAGAFRDVGIPTERVMASIEGVCGQMTGIAPEPIEPPKPRFSLLRRRRPTVTEQKPTEPYMTPALANVTCFAARDVQREGGEEVELIDLLQTMIQYEEGGTYQILTEGLHIDKDAFLAAIKRRRVMQEPFNEARRVFGLDNEPLDEQTIASLSPVTPFPASQTKPLQVHEEETWTIEQWREHTSKWEQGKQFMTALTLMVKGEERIRVGKQLLAMELLPDDGGWLTESLYHMSRLSDQALARMVLSMDTPPQPHTSSQQ